LKDKRFIIANMHYIFLLFSFLLIFPQYIWAEREPFSVSDIKLSTEKKDTIIRIDIEGNKIVSNATIISKIKIRAGQTYNENVINEDIKSLIATGFFETVNVEKRDVAEGVVVVFKLKEKPVLKKIIIKGNRFIRKQNILKAIDIKEGTFIDEYKLKETARKIRGLYTKRGFSQAKVDYSVDISKEKNEA
jgi:outer membrane protein insertion porin family